jgi:hypothetical protein
MFCVFLSIRCTLVNFNCNFLGLLLNLLTRASLAHLCWIDSLALTTALIARPSLLRVHTRSELHHDSSHATALAGLASLNGLGVRATNTIAFSADAHAFNFDFSLLSIVNVLKSDLQLHTYRLDLLLLGSSICSATTHTEEVKDIIETSRLGTALHPFLTNAIVQLTFLGVRQSLICYRNLFELEYFG